MGRGNGTFRGIEYKNPMNTCDICGYEHPVVVKKAPDGLYRCKICRHRVMYGKYVHSLLEEERLHREGNFTPYWKSLKEEL